MQPVKIRRLRNFATVRKLAGCEILQAAKISQSCKFFAMLHFLLFSAPLSFWFLICNDDFDSNSLCLDRPNYFGINSLQKLQNLPQSAISRITGTLMFKLG